MLEGTTNLSSMNGPKQQYLISTFTLHLYYKRMRKKNDAKHKLS